MNIISHEKGKEFMVDRSHVKCFNFCKIIILGGLSVELVDLKYFKLDFMKIR